MIDKLANYIYCTSFNLITKYYVFLLGKLPGIRVLVRRSIAQRFYDEFAKRAKYDGEMTRNLNRLNINVLDLGQIVADKLIEEFMFEGGKL